MSTTRTLRLISPFLALLISVGISSEALAENSCIKDAFKRMAGEFEAKGKQVGEKGELEDFSQKFIAKLDEDTVITFISGEKKYGTWSFADDGYVFVTYDKNGAAVGRPITVGYKCENRREEIILSEEWNAGDNGGSINWKMLQVRRIKTESMNVAVYAKDPNSNNPPVVMTVYNAVKM